MSTAVLDEQAERRATVRAQAAAIADAPRPPRRFVVDSGARLRSSSRQRRHLRQRVPVVVASRKTSSLRRVVAAAVLLAQVALLMLLLNLPVFKVHDVAVSGTSLLSPDAVMRAALVPDESIFTVDGNAIRSRLLAVPWVEAATVTTELPATVRIAVVERKPVLRIRRAGADTLFAGNGAGLAGWVTHDARWSSLPILLDDRVGSAQPVDAQLIGIMSATAAGFRSVLRCGVAAYQWDAGNVLSIWTTTGWRAVLGHLDTADALAAVPEQLAALGALRGQLNFAAPTFGYIDLENPAAPAVGGKPGLPAEILSAGSGG